MWEYNAINLYVEKHWNCIYEMLKSHNRTEAVNIWCGVILNDIRDKFPKIYKESELFIKSR